jgi:hypothetical protein
LTEAQEGRLIFPLNEVFSPGPQAHRALKFLSLWDRIREALREAKLPGGLGGANKVVGIDETYVGGKEANKHESKRRKDGASGVVGKAPVLVLVEREGAVHSFHVPHVSA